VVPLRLPEHDVRGKDAQQGERVGTDLAPQVGHAARGERRVGVLLAVQLALASEVLRE